MNTDGWNLQEYASMLTLSLLCPAPVVYGVTSPANSLLTPKSFAQPSSSSQVQSGMDR